MYDNFILFFSNQNQLYLHTYFYIIDVKTNTANLNLQNADSAKSIGKKYAILRFLKSFSYELKKKIC